MIKRALVVDDDELIRTFMNTLLTKKFGLRVVTSKNGFEGLDELQKGGIDIVFLDIMMPQLDGVGFMEMMRSDSKYSDIPVVIISAVNHKDTVSKLLRLGVNDYILKPLEFMTITEKMHDLFLKYD